MITWTEKTVNINELIPCTKNPRRISTLRYERLKNCLKVNGYHSRIKADLGLNVIGGHQRLKALKELGFTEIIIQVPDRELTREEFERILVSDNFDGGEYDYDILANQFDLSELADWGMDMDWMLQDAEDEQPDNTEKYPKYILQYHAEQLEVFCQAIDMATDAHPNDMNSEELSEAVLSICYDYIASKKLQ